MSALSFAVHLQHLQDHPKYAVEHQLAVIECLEDPDETLKRKTLDLLYSMTNPINVEFIAVKLLRYIYILRAYTKQLLVRQVLTARL
jgi:hypothetical protein